jgi:hypothetical protein
MNLVKLLQRPDPSASPDGLESLLLTIGRYGELRGGFRLSPHHGDGSGAGVP